MTIFVIIDGAGLASPDPNSNAVRPDTLPAVFGAMEEFGYATLDASGKAVGLRDGESGNSEVGHVTLGAGVCVPSPLSKIETAYLDGSFAQNPLWTRLEKHPEIHIAGFISDAGTHGHINSLINTARIASAHTSRVVVHPVLDGVDSQAGSAVAMYNILSTEISKIPNADIGVVMGRHWFADRSGDVSLSQTYAKALSAPQDLPQFSLGALLQHLTQASEASFPPHVVALSPRAGAPLILTQNREDRVRQVANALDQGGPIYSLIDVDGAVPATHAFFAKVPLSDGLSHRLRAAGRRTQRISETCKFPHVTFFLNGRSEGDAQEGICISSWPEAELAQHPEMRAKEICDAVVTAARDATCDLIVVNLPNLDQIGHLGRLDLAEQAAKAVNDAIVDIRQVAAETDRNLVLTADHGNAETLIDPRGMPFGSHTKNPVPFVIIPRPGAPRPDWRVQTGGLANVAATLMHLMGQPDTEGFEMSLIRDPDTNTDLGGLSHAFA